MKHLLTLIAVVVLAPVVRGDNIWDRRDPKIANLFQDNRARNVGDLITVVVSETTTTNDREQRQNDKNNTASGTFTWAIGAGGSPSANDNFRRQFQGSAQLTSTRTFTDRFQATVVDVLPNGNLVIEGYRSRVVQGEERVLRVTGVIRPVDIAVGNIIASAAIANCRLSYLGRGNETRQVNQNLLGRIMNRLWLW